MKIYVASSWRNLYQQIIVNLLRSFDHEVYDFRNPKPGDTGFDWKDINPDWKFWTPEQYRTALKDPIAESGFKNDFDAIQWADVCVLVMPCGRSAHTEAGWMKGAGKKVYVYQQNPAEPELMYKIFDGIFVNFTELYEYFCGRKITKVTPGIDEIGLYQLIQDPE